MSKPEVGLNEREEMIALEAFTTGRVYAAMGEKEGPVEIHDKLMEKCGLIAKQYPRTAPDVEKEEGVSYHPHIKCGVCKGTGMRPVLTGKAAEKRMLRIQKGEAKGRVVGAAYAVSKKCYRNPETKAYCIPDEQIGALDNALTALDSQDERSG